VFRACVACHTLTPDGGNRAGPTLHGVIGRRIGTARDYAFSEALRGMDIVWSEETIARLFEIGPNAYTPGTKMPEQIVADPDDRRALVEWLSRVTR
jgi:cytochrome c